jgi:hypothetical protein
MILPNPFLENARPERLAKMMPGIELRTQGVAALVRRAV